MSRIAVVLFNLGGPDGLDAVKPFLRNLFSDPAIISAPAPVRWFLARLISARRASHARSIYAKIGGSSPIRMQTEKQARALEEALADLGIDGFVWPAGMADPLPYMQSFAETVIPRVNSAVSVAQAGVT